MSFGRLLAMGRSWAGGTGMGRYQMQAGFHLPKFISPRNPFKSEAATEAMPLEPSAPTTIPVIAGASLPGKTASPWARAGNGVLNGLRHFALFCLDHNPFSGIGRPKLPGIPRFGKGAVQGELSLDQVKVARNDLSDSDWEVISTGRQTVRIFSAGMK